LKILSEFYSVEAVKRSAIWNVWLFASLTAGRKLNQRRLNEMQPKDSIR